jgi:hypothetical protein
MQTRVQYCQGSRAALIGEAQTIGRNAGGAQVSVEIDHSQRRVFGRWFDYV